jgi:hypothetical protein
MYEERGELPFQTDFEVIRQRLMREKVDGAQMSILSQMLLEREDSTNLTKQQIFKIVSKHLNASVDEQRQTVYKAGTNQKMLSEASSRNDAAHLKKWLNLMLLKLYSDDSLTVQRLFEKL